MRLIKKFGFVEGRDYATDHRSPNPGTGNRGASIEYYVSLDMAKELAMVENNPTGRRLHVDGGPRAASSPRGARHPPGNRPAVSLPPP